MKNNFSTISEIKHIDETLQDMYEVARNMEEELKKIVQKGMELEKERNKLHALVQKINPGYNMHLEAYFLYKN